MNSNFSNKTILVVGGTSGIGHAICKELIEQGATVFSLSRRESNDIEGVNHIQANVLEDLNPIAGMLPSKLDGLVYAPGSINLKPFNRLTTTDFLQDFEINVIGAVKILQLTLNSLKSSGSASVVLFSTVAAKTGMGFHASVAASKSAIEGLSISLAAEYSQSKIRVNVIAPSLTDTPLAAALLSTDEKRMASDKRHPLGRIGNSEEIAESALFLLSDKSSWMTGQVLRPDGGMSVVKTF